MQRHTPAAASSATCEAPRMESAPQIAMNIACSAISTASGIRARSILRVEGFMVRR